MSRNFAIRALALRLVRQKDGVTAVEFALAAPVLLILLLGIYDIGHMAYSSAVLHGAVEEVARRAALETASVADEDAYVRGVIQGVAPGATVTTTRESYYDFTDVDRPESWNDANSSGACDNSESYTDENRNGRWDADVGQSGNGGANDVVIYKVTVAYTPLFPVPFMTNHNQQREISATTVKKNQPFATQTTYGSSAGTCG